MAAMKWGLRVLLIFGVAALAMPARAQFYDLDGAYPGLFARVAAEIDDKLSLAIYRPDDVGGHNSA